ncbi:BTAD domain-containing putative transcriptional regulator [Nonomuraea sp. LP-02]|uniref:AfsR/SARP family transcriptional regulator n=1 Tax=Nonomuraea sp. LP-02 TaxID=3097960 RepID=UPI002E30193F|nr:BTAD domain-containing putative transcriptional regulator [Nonomuraea sp. LP-02]MED7929216.1 BTAD domain-containing putative transcriptional regulator [Nonomuraea sp. LP-02]
MEFRVLGPLEVAVSDDRLDLGGSRQQTLLAVLVLEPNRVVTMGRLIEAIYDDNPPTTSRSQVQICISSLRRLFSRHGAPALIATHSHGYMLQADDDYIDFQRFIRLTGQARQSREAGRPEEAVRHLRQALALWRGTALEGIDSRLVQMAASRLHETRIAVNEERLQLELDLGNHHELVPELTELVKTYPLRERIRGQLMLALYRSGRQAEALQAYRDARRTAIEELGIEPNEQLQRLEHGILTSDEKLAAPAPPKSTVTIRQDAAVEAELDPDRSIHALQVAVPRMLPTDIGDFTGRDQQVEDIRQYLIQAAEDPARFAVPIVTISGKAGVGKSTIAVHVSHSLSERFPGGQLYANLHGAAARPLSAGHVLERFIRAMGVPASIIPKSLDERAEMYRALLADRKVLVVLDDAQSESQLLPLLPGEPTSAVVVTGRQRLAGLAGALHIEVEVFEMRQSIDLLSRIAGDDRVRAEQQSSAKLARLCGHLPFALRIAGARLSARPHWSIEQLAGRLEDETRRLDELKHGGMEIRASILLTYESISEEARRLFRLLAILDFATISPWVGAALLGRPVSEPQDLLDDLADAQLIEATGLGRQGGYRFHDLIKVFAREQLATVESPAERKAALARVLGALLYLAEAAHRKEYGGDYAQIHSRAARWPLPDDLVGQLVQDPLQWYEQERMTLVSGIRQAAQAGFAELAWDLAISTVTLFESRVYFEDWRDTHEIALAAAKLAGDVRGQAAMLYSLGSLHLAEQRFSEARTHFDAALTLFQETGESQGIGLVIRNLALLDRMIGRYEEAAALYEEALHIFQRTGDHAAAAHVINSLAQLRLDSDDVDGSKELLTRALRLSRESGSRRVEAQVLHRMGHTHLHAGEPAEAVQVFEQARQIVRRTGDRAGEAYALHGLGLAHLCIDDHHAAETALKEALELTGVVGHRLAEARIRLAMGEVALSRRRPQEAVPHLRDALTLFKVIKAPMYTVNALILLSDAHMAVGHPETARQVLLEARTLCEALDSPPAKQLSVTFSERLLEHGIS